MTLEKQVLANAEAIQLLKSETKTFADLTQLVGNPASDDLIAIYDTSGALLCHIEWGDLVSVITPASSSETVEGVIEIATQAETNAKTDDARAVTPLKLANWTGSTNIVEVGVIATGTWQGTVVAAPYLPDASDSAEGVVQLATQAEVNGATEASKAIVPLTLGGWNGSTNIITVGTIGTGTWQGTAIASAYMAQATESAKGALEIATSAEIDTASDTTRAMVPGNFKATDFATKTLYIEHTARGTDVATGYSPSDICIGSDLDGWELFDVTGTCETLGTTCQVDFNVERFRGGAIIPMLSTDVTIGSGEYTANDGVIDTTYDDVLQGDKLRIDVNSVSGLVAKKGLVVAIEFRKP